MHARRIKPYPTIPAVRGESSSSPWEMAITGELSDKQGELLGRLVELPRGSSGVCYFDSCGGSVYLGLASASIIKLRGLKVTGVVAGECSSAALLPFAACKRRFVTPHSTLLFHPMRWQTEEDVRLEEAAEWARHFSVLEEDLDKLLVRLFKSSTEQLADWTNPGRFVTGQEMVDAGLAEMIDLFSSDLWSRLKP